MPIEKQKVKCQRINRSFVHVNKDPSHRDEKERYVQKKHVHRPLENGVEKQKRPAKFWDHAIKEMPHKAISV